MVISFTGAQSCGKSTLLHQCKEEYGVRFSYVEEVTRLVKREYNVPINEDGDDVTQMLILMQHFQNAYKYTENVIMDRCIVDGLIYTAWLFDNEKVSAYVAEFAVKTFERLLSRIDIIFHCVADFPLVDDGERSNNINFRNDIATAMSELLGEISDAQRGPYNLPIIVNLTGSVEERMHTIRDTINNYGTNPR